MRGTAKSGMGMKGKGMNGVVRNLLFVGATAMLALSCSSSDNNAPDGGSDAGGGHGGSAGKDGAAGSGGGGAGGGATDAATDAPSNDDGATPGDGGVLTAQQMRGQYLVNNVVGCPDCHTPRLANGMPDPTKYLAGNPDFAVAPNGDKLGSRNLTNHETGLKNRTDDEIKGMFLNGQRPTQTGMEALNPTMPYYVFHNMTADDASAIVAYLRTVPGVESTIPRRGPFWDPANNAPATPLDVTMIPKPADSDPNKDSAMRGRYLATQSGVCIECHTKHIQDPKVLDYTKFFAGGESFEQIYPNAISKNLTPDATGIPDYTVADIVQVLKMGIGKDGKPVCPPMPVGPNGPYGGLQQSDATDIANYIKSLPPIVNAVPDMCVFPPPPADGGTDGAPVSDGAIGG